MPGKTLTRTTVPENLAGMENAVIQPAKTASQAEVAELAYRRWIERGCPQGSPEEDWFAAEKELRIGTKAMAAVG